jgi:capsular polysaccharide export protein
VDDRNNCNNFWQNKRILLLQGSMGWFFNDLAKQFLVAGATVSKVNFNGGDEFFYRQPQSARSHILSFSGNSEQYNQWLQSNINLAEIDLVCVFGGSRKYHVLTAKMPTLTAPIIYFEEGYIRPMCITAELNGNNGSSDMCTKPLIQEEMLAYIKQHQDVLTRKQQQKQSLKPSFIGLQSVLWISVYILMYRIKMAKFPHYVHHRKISLPQDMISWIKNYFSRYYQAISNKKILHKLRAIKSAGREVYLCPLQVFFDSQLQYSNYRDPVMMITQIIKSFASHAEKDSVLVFKHHPLDRPYRDYTNFINKKAMRYGVVDRIIYVDNVHLPTYLKLADGVITMNSTVGMSALYHKKPVITLGTAVYNRQGLTFQGKLQDFWQHKTPPCQKLFTVFSDYIMIKSQLVGSFYHCSLSSSVAKASLSHIRRVLYDLR